MISRGDDGLHGEFPEEEEHVAARLVSARPRPGPTFLARLRDVLADSSPPVAGPRYLKSTIASFAAAGTALLLAAAVTFL
jgi:hypothetical protein